VQDGPKVGLLCFDCEQLFCAWEKIFAENIFSPFHDRSIEILPYGPWALKFAVSVSWRVFRYLEPLGGLDNLTAEQQREALLACRHWEEFMKGARPHPGIYEQHMIALDVLEHVSEGECSPFLNRYILRSIGIDVVAWDDCAMVYTKLGRLLLFGFLTGQERRNWVQTRLHLREGRIGAKHYKVPPFIFDYINDLSGMTAKATTRLSTKQYENIERTFLKNAEEGRESEFIRALRQDFRLFGKPALTVATPERVDESDCPTE
jgi:hypothetical protein